MGVGVTWNLVIAPSARPLLLLDCMGEGGARDGGEEGRERERDRETDRQRKEGGENKGRILKLIIIQIIRARKVFIVYKNKFIFFILFYVYVFPA